MAFINPFNRISKNINEQTYLRVAVGNFMGLPKMPPRFYDAIRDLIPIREGLLAAQQASMLPQLQPNFYMDAIRWLNLEIPLQQGATVQQVTNLGEITDEIAEQFFQYVQWYKNNYLASSTYYQQIQAQLGAAKVAAYNKLDIAANEIEAQFKQSLRSSQESLNESIAKQTKSLNKDLIQQFDEQKNQVRQTGEEAYGRIQQAQALEEWKEYYQEKVDFYEEKLSGKKWRPLHTTGRLRNLQNHLKNRRSHYKQWKSLRPEDKIRGQTYFAAVLRSLKSLGYVMRRTLAWLYTLIKESITWSVYKLFCIKGRRIFWFLLLAAVLVTQAVIVFSVVTTTDAHQTAFQLRISNLLKDELILTKLSAFLGLVLVPSLGYASANKNYRIYSNLLEQYRHRGTVAQTLQGILRNIDQGEDNKDIRQNLAAVAAAAMFELKAVGHLTKSDGGNTPFSEVVQGLFGTRH